jgi:dethiobiotin synthetase
MKPFCSGGTADVDLIQSIQGSPPSRDEINPFYFPEPVAPLLAARKARRSIQLSQVLESIKQMECQCERLIVEGSGGLLVPLGEGFTVADVIAKLVCEVIVVGRNKLGTINHTLLTLEALRARAVTRTKVILMGQSRDDFSAQSNRAVLTEMLENTEVYALPYLGSGACRAALVKRNAGKLKKTLAQIIDPDSFSPVLRAVCKTSSEPKGLERRKKIVDSQCSGTQN